MADETHIDPTDAVRDHDIRQLWRAHNETTAAVARLEERVASALEQWTRDRDARKPLPVLSYIAVIFAALVPLFTLGWAFIEVRVAPAEEILARIERVDSLLADDIHELQAIARDRIIEISFEQGEQTKELEWLRLLSFQLKDDRDDSDEEFKKLAERIGEMRARQVYLENWLRDVDQGGSRRWIEGTPRGVTSK